MTARDYSLFTYGTKLYRTIHREPDRYLTGIPKEDKILGRKYLYGKRRLGKIKLKYIVNA